MRITGRIPVGQPTSRDTAQEDGDAVGNEEQADVRAGGLGTLGEVRDDDPPVRDEQQDDRR